MNLEKYHFNSLLENSEDRKNFTSCHPRNMMVIKNKDEKFYESTRVFKQVAMLFQAQCVLGEQKKIDKNKNNDLCILMVASHLGLDLRSPHTRILKSLAKEIREATGLKIIFVDTNESNENQDGPPKSRIYEDDGAFDETWQLDGDLALKWDSLQDIIEKSNCSLIVTLGGMYESFMAPSAATLNGIKSLLYKTNGNAIPINDYDKVYGYDSDNGDRRVLPLSDIEIAENASKLNAKITNEKPQVVTAMRFMESKVKQSSPLIELIKKQLTINENIDWTIMGIAQDAAITRELDGLKGLHTLPMKPLVPFVNELSKHDIFYHDPEHINGGVGTISMAYFLGQIVIVTNKNDVWSLIDKDSGCHTGEDMDRMLELEIHKMAGMSLNERLEEKLKRVKQRRSMYDKRRIAHLQWLRPMIEDLIGTEV